MKLESMILALLLAPTLGWGMSVDGQAPAAADGQPGAVARTRLGVIESIESSQVGNDGESAAGPVIGGVVAGVPAGPAPSVCVVAGALGADPAPGRTRIAFKPGAAAGRKAAYFIRVRLEDDSRQTVTQIGLGGLRVGDSVRLDRFQLTRCEPSPIEAVSAPDGDARAR